MTTRPPPTDGPDLAARLGKIKTFEGEIPRQAQALLGNGDINHTDFFMLGALRRILAQAKGFRGLIENKNFPCAAAILRLQLDTAMRLNGLMLVDDMNAACKAVLDDTPFNKLKDRDGVRLQDVRLRKALAEEHPWIDEVYKQTSDFIHLSGRHFYGAIAHTNDDTRMAYFMIGGEDPARPETVYYEIADVFLRASKLAGDLILGYLTARRMAVSAAPGSP